MFCPKHLLVVAVTCFYACLPQAQAEQKQLANAAGVKRQLSKTDSSKSTGVDSGKTIPQIDQAAPTNQVHPAGQKFLLPLQRNKHSERSW